MFIYFYFQILIGVAKCLTNMYAIGLLVLFLKIELNIIGGYLFLNNSFTDFSSMNLTNVSVCIHFIYIYISIYSFELE